MRTNYRPGFNESDGAFHTPLSCPSDMLYADRRFAPEAGVETLNPSLRRIQQRIEKCCRTGLSDRTELVLNKPDERKAKLEETNKKINNALLIAFTTFSFLVCIQMILATVLMGKDLALGKESKLNY